MKKITVYTTVYNRKNQDYEILGFAGWTDGTYNYYCKKRKPGSFSGSSHKEPWTKWFAIEPQSGLMFAEDETRKGVAAQAHELSEKVKTALASPSDKITKAIETMTKYMEENKND